MVSFALTIYPRGFVGAIVRRDRVLLFVLACVMLVYMHLVFPVVVVAVMGVVLLLLVCLFCSLRRCLALEVVRVVCSHRTAVTFCGRRRMANRRMCPGYLTSCVWKSNRRQVCDVRAVCSSKTRCCRLREACCIKVVVTHLGRDPLVSYRCPWYILKNELHVSVSSCTSSLS